MATEVRFAFALNGGVSLAIWIGGVGDEILRFIDGGRRAASGEPDGDNNPYIALCRELDVLPKVDVLVGSSAGGLNAAFLGCAVVHGCPNLEPIRSLWLNHGAFDRLLRRHTDSALISLLNGDDNFLPHIEEAFRLIARNGTGFSHVDPPVAVRLTATALAGRVSVISDGRGQISSVDHRGEFVFTTSDFDIADDERAIARLARACRSTASFPGAFEPSDVPIDLYEPRHVIGLFDGAIGPTVSVIDGAVLVNLPASSAIEAIIAQPSRERVERVLALVVPDPGELVVADRGVPTLNEVLSKSIVGIPRTQSLTDFVRELDDHNLEVRSRRIARESLLAQFAKTAPGQAWTAMETVATALFDGYQATRVATSVAQMRRGVPALMPEGSPPLDLSGLDDIDVDALPWVADDFTPGTPAWCWGTAPVRRLAAVLITWVNEVAAVAGPDLAPSLYALKQKVGAARTSADAFSPSSSVFEKLLADELQRGSSDVAAACERACVRWPYDDPESTAAVIAALNCLLDTIAGCFHEFIELIRSILESPAPDVPDNRGFVALRGLVQLHDGALTSPDGLIRLLLCIEVIEATFSGTEPRSDQVIQLVQFTAEGAAMIDPLQRTAPVDKLAGVELAHFGAFLKRSWRANDWMWGRLDAAERLVRLVDSLAANRLTKADTLDDHIRAAQATVLREELPSVLAEVEADGELGARSSAEGKAFCVAVRTMVGTPSGPVNLAALTQQQLQQLLAVQLVGLENIGMEVGSNLATLTSISALATTAGILRVNGPRMLRMPVRVLGVSSTMAWRIAQRGPVGRLRAIEAVAAIVAILAIGLVGLVGTVIDLFSDVDLGVLRYVSWALLALAVVLTVFAVPFMMLVVARRMLSRQTPH